MPSSKIYRPASEVTGVRIGDVIVTACGMEVTVTDVQVEGMHLPRPTVFVSYDYDDNSHKGKERVTLANFYNNIHS